MDGKLVASKAASLTAGLQQVQLDLSDLPSGIYEVVANLKNGTKVGAINKRLLISR